MCNIKYPLISVIIPVYNAENYIKYTIDSALNQTYKNIEVIVVDDCSSDKSIAIIEESHCSKIKIIKSKLNLGVANARNLGIKNSSGELIAFLDSDDIWEPYKLEKQYEALIKENASFCYTGYCMIDTNNQLLKEKINVPTSTSYNSLLKSNVIACSTVLVKRSLLQNLFFSNEKHEDYILWLSIAKNNKEKMIGINSVQMRYRKHSNSISANKIKSAKWMWNIYRKVENLSLFKSIYYFIFYAVNGIKKHY